MTTWDTVVIGGGPAGSTAAAVLARAGQKVLVLERDAFPRFHIGESLIPYGNDILRDIGVWEKMEQAGFMPKLGAEFTLGNAAGSVRFRFGRNLAPRHAQTFQVERARFDDLLLRHAESVGATVEHLAKVSGLEVNPDGATIAYDRNGARHEARARWIVDASGRAAVVGHALGVAKSDLGMPKRLAIFAHFEGVHRSQGATAGDIVIVRLENAWCWLIPLDETRTSVGLVQPLDDFKAQGLAPEESFQRAIDDHAELRFRLKGARRLCPFRTEGDYTFRHERAAGPRWLLAGDAAGFIDPIFSSGVMVALHSSHLAAEAILRAEAKGRALTPREQQSYTRAVKKMTGSFLDMIRMFYDRSAFEVFMAPTPPLDLPRAVGNLVAGNTQLSWNLRWRVWVFYALCRLQRHLPVVPRLSFRETRRVPAGPRVDERVACPPIA
jgi:flavin-dependent dehydrogenase